MPPAPPAPLWLARPSRFAALPRPTARIMLGLLAVAMVVWVAMPDIGRWLWPSVTAVAPERPGDSDLALYAQVADAVAHGVNYYRATAEALRAHAGYPLRPFFTFREPLLAYVQASLPRPALLALLWLVTGGVAFAWSRRLITLLPSAPARIVAALLIAGGLITVSEPLLVGSHELWAGLLIAASLALRRPGHWGAAVAIGLLAMLVRELALLYPLVMLAFAWRDGERREMLAWAGGIALFALALGTHAAAVMRVTSLLDPVSDGWLGLHGAGFVSIAIRHATVLEALPGWIAAILVPLTLVGWIAWPSGEGPRAAAVLGMVALLIGGCARYNNFYWGLIAAPLWLLGLIAVPDALRDLVVAARRKPLT